MGLFEDYESYYQEWSSKFGDKTVILYQNGYFHNVYGLDNEQETLGNVDEVATVLGIKSTRLSTKILTNSRKNPQMAGFNSVGLDDRVDRLVNYGYSVVVVNQVPDTDPLERKVAYISSPSTRISSDNGVKADPYLVSIYLDQYSHRSTGQSLKYIGMSAMDATTGESYYYEKNSTPGDPMLAEDDLTRFMQTFNPVEIVLVYSKRIPLDHAAGQELCRQWGCRLSARVKPSSGISGTSACAADSLMGRELKPTVFLQAGKSHIDQNIAKQETYFSQYFLDHGSLNVLEYLSLESMEVARLSYIYLLEFCATRNPRLLEATPRPVLWGQGGTMVLDTSSIIQLNIVDSYYNTQRQKSVMGLATRFLRTAMGRRLLRNRMLNPITDTERLNSRYDQVETMRQRDDLEQIKDSIPFPDLDRLHRRLTLGVLTPAELYTLDCAYGKIETMIAGLMLPFSSAEHLEDGANGLAHIKRVRDKYSMIDMVEAGKNMTIESIQDSIFRLGYSVEMDELSSKVRSIVRTREILCQKLSDLVTPGSSYCVYREDRTGANLGCNCTMSKPQYRKFKANFKAPVTAAGITIAFDDLVVDDRNKGNVKITTACLTKLYYQHGSTVQTLCKLSKALYSTVLKESGTLFSEMMQISHYVACQDLYQGIAHMSLKYDYCRPEIIIPTQVAQAPAAPISLLRAHKLRHPLVERQHIYIPQDISLGKTDDKDDGSNGSTGMLLYGVNQTGKSCTMKSVGVAVIMAQAGLYVPAASFKYYPYDIISTRIQGNDSLDKGLSTFAAEMIELRSMLTRCTARSLNLGDEVCHGTESASAVSLVAASVMHMASVKACFIFATHLHELSRMEEIREIKDIKHYHLTVDFKDGSIVYNRHMKEGSGLGLYGIEVAKHLRIPEVVLFQAYAIRNKYFREEGAPLPTEAHRTSRYNSSVIVSHCKVPQCTAPAEHTHHIRYQSEYSDTGTVDGSHKDLPDNLAPLCKMHHDMVHGHGHGHTCLVIFGYKDDGTLDCAVRKIISSLEG